MFRDLIHPRIAVFRVGLIRIPFTETTFEVMVDKAEEVRPEKLPEFIGDGIGGSYFFLKLVLQRFEVIFYFIMNVWVSIDNIAWDIWLLMNKYLLQHMI